LDSTTTEEVVFFLSQQKVHTVKGIDISRAEVFAKVLDREGRVAAFGNFGPSLLLGQVNKKIVTSPDATSSAGVITIIYQQFRLNRKKLLCQ
jgi:hypothetical protein